MSFVTVKLPDAAYAAIASALYDRAQAASARAYTGRRDIKPATAERLIAEARRAHAEYMAFTNSENLTRST